jgi:hypothetical protein
MYFFFTLFFWKLKIENYNIIYIYN